jgi:DNA-binding transcriptional ArsR family regulator
VYDQSISAAQAIVLRKRKPRVAKDPLVVAMGHPTRVRILRALGESNLSSPTELAAELGIDLNDASYHVRILATCKAISLVDTEQVRGSLKHYYRRDLHEPWALEAITAMALSEGSDVDSSVGPETSSSEGDS